MSILSFPSLKAIFKNIQTIKNKKYFNKANCENPTKSKS